MRMGERAGFRSGFKGERVPVCSATHLYQPLSILAILEMNVLPPQVTELHFSRNLLETRQSPGRISLTCKFPAHQREGYPEALRHSSLHDAFSLRSAPSANTTFEVHLCPGLAPPLGKSPGFGVRPKLESSAWFLAEAPLAGYATSLCFCGHICDLEITQPTAKRCQKTRG